MNRFEATPAGHRLTLRRGQRQTLQINAGRNQACRHCRFQLVRRRVREQVRVT